MTVPQGEQGYASGSAWWSGPEDLEETPELRWPMNIAVYDRMRRQDAQVISVLRAVTLPIRRTGWRLDPNGARDEVVQLVADDLGLQIAGEPDRPVTRTRDRFSWPDHLRLALLMLVFGHSPFEQVYRIDEVGRARLRKLAWRPPRTISKVEVAADGGLVALEQVGAVGGKTARMEVDRLVLYTNDREGGNWLGQSLLRPAYKFWLLKDRLLRVGAQTVDRNGMGVPIYSGADYSGAIGTPDQIRKLIEDDLKQGLNLARGLRSGDSSGASIPFGAQLTMAGVQGTLPDADTPVRYYDEQIARAVLAHFLNLGTETGSWALGSTFADFFTLSLQTVAQDIATTATQHIVEDLVDLNWGTAEPAPRIVFDEIGSRHPATAEALKLLRDAGILIPDDALEQHVRTAYSLPASDRATARPITTTEASGGGRAPGHEDAG